jgi:hypothetical protein
MLVDNPNALLARGAAREPAAQGKGPSYVAPTQLDHSGVRQFRASLEEGAYWIKTSTPPIRWVSLVFLQKQGGTEAC